LAVSVIMGVSRRMSDYGWPTERCKLSDGQWAVA
jgi:hypothetical protein